MAYQVGIDLGAENAVVSVIESGWPEVVALGGAPSVPPALHFGTDGQTRAGRAALRRGASEPDGLAQDFIAALGDGTPVLVGGTAHTAESMLARFLSWVISATAKTRGAQPDRVVVAHPTSWPARRREALADACARVEAVDVPIVTATAAGATAALLTRQGRSRPGEYLGVYDLGPRAFEAFVLAAMPGGFKVAGTAAGLSVAGTALFDRIMFAHVLRSAGLETSGLSRPGGGAADPTATPEGRRLLAECGHAVDALVEEDSVAVAVPAALVGGPGRTVTVSRTEFQALLAPTIEDTVRATERSIRSVPAEPGDLNVLIVRGAGGRAALVTPRLTEAFPGVARQEIRPESDVAMGAAILASDAVRSESSRAQTVLIGRPSLDPPPSVPPGRPSWPPAAAAASASASASASATGPTAAAGPGADQTSLLAQSPTAGVPVVAASPAPPGAPGGVGTPAPPGAYPSSAATGHWPVGVAAASGVGAAPPAGGAGGATGGGGGSSAGGRGGWRRPSRLIAAAAVLLVFAASGIAIGLVVTGGGSSTSVADIEPLPTSGPQVDLVPAATAPAATVAPTGPNVVVAADSEEVAPITETAYALFRKQQRGVTLNASVTGSEAGFDALCSGKADIIGTVWDVTVYSGAASCQDKVVGFEVAHHTVPIIVNPANTWANCLTLDQVKQIYAPGSTITNWRQIDPSFPNLPIEVVGPPRDSVHAKVFNAEINGSQTSGRNYVERDLPGVGSEVENNRGAIGFVDYPTFKTFGSKVKGLEVNSNNGAGCVAPDAVAIGTGLYLPLCKPLYVYVSKEAVRRPAVAAFLTYYLEQEQAITYQAHYVPRDNKTVEENTAKIKTLTQGVGPVSSA
jgi:ABC-type phosphate transport system substrate-binding protein/actin-like ATPase involved in cell morphogenesis